MAKNDYKIDNTGHNTGVIIAENTGNIEVSIQNVVRIPSLISTIIKALGEICLNDEIDSAFDIKEFKPDEKIEYNCVVKYKDIIKFFSAYYYVCEKFLNAYDDTNMMGKAKILKCVNIWYLWAKGTVLLKNKDNAETEVEIVRQNSDRIIEMVQNKIFETIKTNNQEDNMYVEDMELGITCFTCYCFMECKILEKPL